MEDSQPGGTEDISPFKSLFDMNTVDLEIGEPEESDDIIEFDFDGWSTAGEGKISRQEVVSFPKLVMVDGAMTMVEDRLLDFSKSDSDLRRDIRRTETGEHSPTSHSPPTQSSPRHDDLKLRLVRGCGRTGEDTDDFFSMPLLRLTAVEKGYHEPIRDRDKNWVIQSQREVLNKTPRSQALPPLKLGKYPPRPTDPPSLMWAPELHAMVRKQQLFRTGWIISDTHCVVDVFGIGVCGRVVATGQTKRLLIVEVFSSWNCQKYSIVIKINQLKFLFAGREELFKPGKKRKLVEALLDLLYFEYTVSFPAMLIDGKPFHPPIQVLTHTERATLPEEYPSSVCDIIRSITDPSAWNPPELLDNEDPVPQLKQTLKISSTRRETGFSLRRRERIIKSKQDLIDQADAREKWKQTPCRLRGLMTTRCVRNAGKFLILQVYIFPMNPDVASLRGHAVEEVGRLRMRLALNVAGSLAGFSAPPQRWAHSTAKLVSRFCLRNAAVKGNFHDGYSFFDFFGRRGGGAALQSPKHCFHRIKYLTRHQQNTVRLDKENCTLVAGLPKSQWHPYRNIDQSCGLGAQSSRGKPSWKPQCKCRRDIGRGIKLVSRTRRFGESLGVYTAYMTSKIPHGPIPISTEQARGGGKKLNDEIAPHLAIEIEVYFPFGVSCSSLDEKCLILPAFTTMTIKLYRSDVCALSRKVQNHHDIAFRATYLNFYNESSPQEVSAAEKAWGLIIECILSAGRWAIQYSLPPPPSPPKVETPRDFESIDEAVPDEIPQAELGASEEFDFEMDESLLADALGESNPIKKDKTEEESSETGYEVDIHEWMGGHVVEDLLASYDLSERVIIPKECEKDYSYLKLHIALGREASVRTPPGSNHVAPIFGSKFLPDVPPILTWRWTSVIFKKVITFGSVAELRPSPILQVDAVYL